MSAEKKRLEQDILQRRASNVVLVDPRYGRFQQQANPIDTIRLRQAQQLAGQVPVSERLKKQVNKTRRKARKTKALRGDLSRNLTAQKRFTRGERREKDTEEPRIVGEAAPVAAGFAYDPGIERRRLDIEEARNRDANLIALADRRDRERAQERELAVRRGELAAARADRALERARIAAIPPPAAPAPILLPAPAAPAINIAPAPVRVDVAAPRVDVGGPVINVPPGLPARADADPIPEIQRLSAQIRADTNAFGQEQEDRNRDFFRQLREAAEFEGRQTRETLEAVEARQQAQDENTRVALARQDALNEELQVRLGLHEVEMGRARDAVIQEIRDAEGRLGTARDQLDQPVGYDDVILAADRERLGAERPLRVPIEEVDSPTPERREPEPEEPGGIGGVIAGGGELNLPNVVIEQPGRIGPDESLRLSPEQQARVYPRGTAGRAGGGGRPQVRQGQRVAAEVLGDVIGGAEERLDLDDTPRFGEEGSPDTPLVIRAPTPPTSEEGSQQSLQFQLDEDRLQLDPVEPVNVAEALRLSRLALEEAEPGLLEEEADDAEQQRIRLVDTQDFMAGFDRPVSPQAASPGTRSQRAAREFPVREEAIESPEAIGSPRPEPSTPSTPEQEALLREAYDEEEEEEVGSNPRPGQVAQGIAQFGGAAGPAPDRVIEDAGIQAQPELRPVVPLEDLDVGDEVQYLDRSGQRLEGVVRNIDRVQEGQEDIEQGAAVGVELPGGEIRDTILSRVEPVEEEVGQVQDNRPQAIRDSFGLYQESQQELATGVRQGPRGTRGQRGGVGYRLRNNTDRTLKKVKPGDVVNITGVDAGVDGQGRYRLDTETAAGTRVGLNQLDPLVEDGSFLFEQGHRHELGGHFDEQPYGPPPDEPGLLQQGAEAAGGAAAAVVGGAARLAGGAALGVGQGLVAQLPTAGDVGAALGRGAVAGVAGAGRLAAGAAGAVGGAVFGGEEEEEEDEP